MMQYFSRCGGSVTAGNQCLPYSSSTDECSAFRGARRLLRVCLLRQVCSLWWFRGCVRKSLAGAEVGSCDLLCFFPLEVRAPRFWTYQALKGPLSQVELSKTNIFVSALGVQITPGVCCVAPFCLHFGGLCSNPLSEIWVLQLDFTLFWAQTALGLLLLRVCHANKMLCPIPEKLQTCI